MDSHQELETYADVANEQTGKEKVIPHSLFQVNMIIQRERVLVHY